MDGARAVLGVKNKQIKNLLALGFIAEGINLIIFLHVPDPTYREENNKNATEIDKRNTTIAGIEEKIDHLDHENTKHLHLIIGFGILSVMTFLLFLLDSCKQHELFGKISSQEVEQKTNLELLQKVVADVQDQMITIKVDILEDFEKSLFKGRFNNEEVTEEEEKTSELVLTPKQVSWMVPEAAKTSPGASAR